MKKIMFYANCMGKGGAERVLANLANYLSDKYEVEIVTNLNMKSVYKLNDNIKFIKVDKKSKRNLLEKIINKLSYNRSKKMLDIIKEEQPDIIISFLVEPSIRILELRNKINIPVIISDRNDPNMEYSNVFINKLMKKFYPRADGFVFQTTDAQKYFKNIINCNQEVIPNPVNKNFFIEPFKEEREKVIVNVGRLNEQKNQKLLIDAFKIFSEKEQNKDYKVYIYGEGNLRDKLQNYINIKKLEEKVILKGVINNIKEEIYNKAMFVLSSDYEGMPNALLEAMVLGIPCISTDCSIGGPKDIITNNKNGLLVPIKNKEKLAEAMEKMINDEKLKKSIEENHNIILERFSEDKIYSSWEAFIKKIANKKK